MRLGELQITVVEKGTLESSKNQDAFCNVEGGTSIIMIKPEGTRVKKGELVCELDSAALRDSLTNQQITTKSAEANFENATLTREVAEIAVVEYVEGIFKQDLATVEGEIKLAESDLSRAEDRVDWAQRMFAKGYVSMAPEGLRRPGTQEGPVRPGAGAEQEEGPRWTTPRTRRSRSCKSEVEKARSDELAKKATWELEIRQGKEAREADRGLQDHGAQRRPGRLCQRSRRRAFMSNTPQVEEGAQVRERQKIFSLPDISQDAGQHQGARIAHQQGQAGHEGEDPGRRLLERAARRRGHRRGGPARYRQLLQLGHQGLHDQGQDRFAAARAAAGDERRGDDRGQPARQGADACRCWRCSSSAARTTLPRRSTAGFVQTEVELGLSNEKFVEVKKGVKEGDIVAMSPISLMTDEEKREAFGSTGKATLRDWSKEETADAAARLRPAPAAAGPPGRARWPVACPARGKAAGKGTDKGGGKAASGWPSFSRR